MHKVHHLGFNKQIARQLTTRKERQSIERTPQCNGSSKTETMACSWTNPAEGDLSQEEELAKQLSILSTWGWTLNGETLWKKKELADMIKLQSCS